MNSNNRESAPRQNNSQFYSQFGEDRILNSIFTGVTNGVCVEVGVNDPIKFSNTYFFERLGWQTILVEANPDAWESIRECRTGRLFCCAASDRSGTAPLLVAGKAVGLSTLDFSRSEAISKADGTVTMIEVPLRTLTSILQEAAVDHIDFLSIDVEGHEALVLNGLDSKIFKPRIIVIERNNFTDKAVDSHLKLRGYVRFLATGCNDWYVCSDDQGIVQRARHAHTLRDSIVVFRERLRLIAMAFLPGWLVRVVRRTKHIVRRASRGTARTE